MGEWVEAGGCGGCDVRGELGGGCDGGGRGCVYGVLAGEGWRWELDRSPPPNPGFGGRLCW